MESSEQNGMLSEESIANRIKWKAPQSGLLHAALRESVIFFACIWGSPALLQKKAMGKASPVLFLQEPTGKAFFPVFCCKPLVIHWEPLPPPGSTVCAPRPLPRRRNGGAAPATIRHGNEVLSARNRLHEYMILLDAQRTELTVKILSTMQKGR